MLSSALPLPSHRDHAILGIQLGYELITSKLAWSVFEISGAQYREIPFYKAGYTIRHPRYLINSSSQYINSWGQCRILG